MTQGNSSPRVEGPKDLVVLPKENRWVERVASWARRIALTLAVILPLFFIINALGVRWGWWSVDTGIRVLPVYVGMKLMIATLLAGVVSLLLTLISRRKVRGIFVSALAILIPAAAMGYAGIVSSKFKRLPSIHDITTNTQNIPEFSQAAHDMRALVEGVNTLEYVGKKDKRDDELYSVLQTRAYPDIRPLVLSANREQVFGQALATAEQSGWDVHTQDLKSGIIEAVDTSFWYGFKDDIVIHIHASEGGGTIIDMRSVSRVGDSDLGVNAKRIRSFLKAIK